MAEKKSRILGRYIERAERLAAALELDVDPHFAPRPPLRAAIEVYPHPAIVALFGLEKTLAYKAKRRRTLASRSAALLVLVGHLEALAHADPPFAVGADPADPQRVLVRDSHASRAGCEGRASVTESGATCRRVLPAWAISGEAGR
jgi:predicted RNase H-like nuclease